MNADLKLAPRKKTATLLPGFFAAVALAAAAVGVGTMVFLFNPATHRFYPACLFHELTGLNCPGCGMTRALYALLHGDLRLALKDNALFILTLAVLAAWSVRLVIQILRGQPVTFNLSPGFAWVFLVIALIFAVVRNLPEFTWLSP